MKKEKIILTTLGPKNSDGSRDTINQKIITTIHEAGAGPVCLHALRESYSVLLKLNEGGNDPARPMYLLTLER